MTMLQDRLRDSISRPEESNCFLAAQWRVLSKQERKTRRQSASEPMQNKTNKGLPPSPKHTPHEMQEARDKAIQTPKNKRALHSSNSAGHVKKLRSRKAP